MAIGRPKVILSDTTTHHASAKRKQNVHLIYDILTCFHKLYLGWNVIKYYLEICEFWRRLYGWLEDLTCESVVHEIIYIVIALILQGPNLHIIYTSSHVILHSPSEKITLINDLMWLTILEKLYLFSWIYVGTLSKWLHLALELSDSSYFGILTLWRWHNLIMTVGLPSFIDDGSKITSTLTLAL